MIQPLYLQPAPMISSLIRHLIAVMILPVSAAILVPIWIAQRYAISYSLPNNTQGVLIQSLGIVLFIFGLVLFSASLYHFATQARGTLAPWDPPRQLVLRGPYRFVRNPMISGVIFMLFGEAFVLVSPPHAVWAGAFLA